jgi:restriction system protein
MTKVRTPWFPTYSEVKHLLPLLDGVPKADVVGMNNTLYEQMGTPQNPVDWTEPNIWIPQRLKGTFEALAMRIWKKSGETVNPRYLYGSYMLINTYALLETDTSNVYRLQERGQTFLANDMTLIRELDDVEGILELLVILSGKTKAKRADILPQWSAFLKEHSNYKTDSSIQDTLRNRLINLVDRGLVERNGNNYTLSSTGQTYLSSLPIENLNPRRDVQRAVEVFNEQQRLTMRAMLEKMHPYKFEHLVRDLLEAMGYEDVIVTKQSGDKGVDVVATVQFGITTITEVVQVKRYKGNVTRDEIDKLRGALVYQKAIRGTLITLGGFSKGCAEASVYPGGAPIGLIDGEKLLELLEKHEIGIRRVSLPLLELDEEALSSNMKLEESLN